jgi:hypothetical protein
MTVLYQTMQADEQLFRIGDEIADLLIARLSAARVSGQLPYRRTMLFFFLKSLKTYRSAALLWQQGYGEDAFTLARAIYEVQSR